MGNLVVQKLQSMEDMWQGVIVLDNFYITFLKHVGKFAS